MLEKLKELKDKMDVALDAATDAAYAAYAYAYVDVAADAAAAAWDSHSAYLKAKEEYEKALKQFEEKGE